MIFGDMWPDHAISALDYFPYPLTSVPVSMVITFTSRMPAIKWNFSLPVYNFPSRQ